MANATTGTGAVLSHDDPATSVGAAAVGAAATRATQFWAAVDCVGKLPWGRGAPRSWASVWASVGTSYKAPPAGWRPCWGGLHRNPLWHVLGLPGHRAGLIFRDSPMGNDPFGNLPAPAAGRTRPMPHRSAFGGCPPSRWHRCRGRGTTGTPCFSTRERRMDALDPVSLGRATVRFRAQERTRYAQPEPFGS